MGGNPIEYRCRRTLCRQPLDHMLDEVDVPPRFCSPRCEERHHAFRAWTAYWTAAFLAFLAEIPDRYAGRPLHYLGDNVATLRPNTPPRIVGGKRTLTTKRACNGCGTDIGDATKDELDAAVNGRELPDVRGECLNCAGELSSPGVAVGDDVLYRRADRWTRGVVSVVGANGKLRIDLADGNIAIDVEHGFTSHHWATLDEVVAHEADARATADGAT
jgi:hypothetical protein